MALKYGGKTMPDYSAMRGPCPEGFHMGDRDEREALVAAGATLGAYTRTGTSLAETYAFRYYFKVARGDYIDADRNDIVTADRTALLAYHVPQTRSYQTSGINEGLQVAITGSGGYMLTSCDGSGSTGTNTARVIRPFKDTPAIPGSTRTMTYDGSSIATGAGIFWNVTLGLISVSIDGENWITIADKDLGATNTYSQNNGSIQVDAIGKVFQRGNNYPFPTRGVTLNTSSTQVDASGYGPGNYYYSDTLIIGNRNRETSNNRNLRGGVTGVKQKPVDIVERYYGGKLINDYSAMRGPCPKGFHIMSSDEFFLFRNMGKSIGAISANDDANNVRKYMKIPPSSYMTGTSGEITHPSATNGYGWLRFCKTNTESQAPRLQLGYGVIVSVPNNNRSNAYSIRAVKDAPVVPDSSWTMTYNGSSIATGAGIYWNSTLGLISISADGSTWMTIADKNLGATTAYNESMTLNEIKTDAVCGLIYQRGNCQGVSAFGTINTSSTQVDASAYGPNNYYLSGTFITGSQDWSSVRNDNLRGGVTGMIQKPVKVIEVYYGSTKIRPEEKWDYYYSDDSFNEYQSLVDSVGSVQFVDTGRRFRFNDGVYIGNRTALDFNGTTMRTINLDTLTVTSSKSSSISGRVWYFGNNRILTRMGIADFDGNMVTTFSTTYNSITPGLPGVVWANSGFDIYKGIVDGDNITFTKVGTGGTDQGAGWMFYGKLGAYLINNHDTSGSGYSSYIDPESGAITNFGSGSSQRGRIEMSVAGPDGKLYRKCRRYIGWGLMQKIGTGNEGIVGNSLSTSWLDYGNRWGKFLGNIVSGGMNSNNGTGNGYGSNNYFIATDGTLTKVQDNAFAYDTGISGHEGFIDENGRYYPLTYGGGSGVILKTDKTFTDLNWKNPYLWR